MNFEFWINVELSKIGHHFSSKRIEKLIISPHVNNKKCGPILVLINEKRIEKDSHDF